MIGIRGLAKSYGPTPALDNISLDVNTGETVVIQGPSGSGKTTLLRLIAGFELPGRGEIYLDGELASKPGWGWPPYQRQLGMVFQRSALWPHMSVTRNLLFAMDGIRREDRRSRLEFLLANYGLSALAERYPHQLSGGEARLVALARALAASPKRLLLDEPLTSLDLQLKQRMLELILEQAGRQKITLLYVTHDPGEADSIGGRRIRLEKGQVLS